MSRTGTSTMFQTDDCCISENCGLFSFIQFIRVRMGRGGEVGGPHSHQFYSVLLIS